MRTPFRKARLHTALGLLAAFALSAFARADEAQPLPDRRELWVPIGQLSKALEAEKAVLISREQYATLLRDAGVTKPLLPKAPRAATLSSANYTAKLDGRTAVITADLRINVLNDEWAELPLEFQGVALGDVMLDGNTALAPRVSPPKPAPLPPQPQALEQMQQQREQVQAKQPAAPPAAPGPAPTPEKPSVLLLRGKGEHTLKFTLTAPVQSAAGNSSLAIVLPPTATGRFSLTLPAKTKIESLGPAVATENADTATVAHLALSPQKNTIALQWREVANASVAPIHARVEALYELDAEKASAAFLFRLRSQLGDLPVSFEFTVPPEAKVLAVEAVELAAWEAANGKVTVRLQPGTRRELEIRLDLETASLPKGVNTAALALPLPALAGVPRIEGELAITADDSLVVREVITDAVLRRVPSAGDASGRRFFNNFRFASRPAPPRMTVERAQQRLEADLDTLVQFATDAVYVDRTLTLREQQGRRFSATITLPEGEELLTVRRETRMMKPSPQANAPAQPVVELSEPEWRAEKNVLTITWSDESREPRVFKLRTRREPAQWTALPAAGILFSVKDASVAGAAKVTGYIALVADPAFRLEAQPGETLERRDGRVTPVRGAYAWFRRDTFTLDVRVFKRPAEVLAALTGYALPLEGVLDLHATMNYQFLHGGTRSVRLRVPRELANNFHFDGPQIAERTLADDVWTITFQKELTGAYALGITAQVPVTKQAGAGDAKGYSFEVKVPVIAPLEVARASGLWAVEANTETEISFDAKGLNELDALLAPRLPDYQPRHRVIGVFGWLGADYALGLRGVRHTPASVIGTVVDRLDLETVASTGGLHRHQAALIVRTAGAQFLDVLLPDQAALLSLSVDGEPVKPVADRPGSVRVQLPAKREANTPVAVTLFYETPAVAWTSSGTLALAAPKLAKEIPILKSQWRVWLPEGFQYSKFKSNLATPEPVEDKPLAMSLPQSIFAGLAEEKTLMIGLGSPAESAAPTSKERALELLDEFRSASTKDESRATLAPVIKKLNYIVFPQIDFREASLREALDFVMQKSRQLDPEGTGVNITLSGSAKSDTKITLTLNSVPLIEVVKYLANLADLEYRITPGGVVIAPPDPASRAAEEQTQFAEIQSRLTGLEAKVEVLRGQLESGQYDLALRKCEEMLNLDPNNAAVRKLRETIYVLKDQSTVATYNAARSQAIWETDKLWDRPSRRLVARPGTMTLYKALETFILPKVEFHETTLREAIAFLVIQSKQARPDGTGISIVTKLDEQELQQKITLTLTNVPILEVIRYITNLTNTKYKIEPFAVLIVPLGVATEEMYIREWVLPPAMFSEGTKTNADGTLDVRERLQTQGVLFPAGSLALYSKETGTLIVKNTSDQLDLVERIVEVGEFHAPAGRRTAGLLPVLLDLPRNGHALVFDGLYAPERIELRYDDWWSHTRRLWLWFVGGGVAFYLLARQRPWWRTIWAVLVLSAVPLCGLVSWTAICNALLGGWLAALVLNRIAAWCVFRVRKEVTA